MIYLAARPAVASIKGKNIKIGYTLISKQLNTNNKLILARTFATASRATAAGSRRVAMMATAGVATASAISYAYLQSK